MKVLYIEASSGQVVGGSLTGMLELISGLDRARYEPHVVLYEEKPMVAELRKNGVAVTIFDGRRRLPKQHGLQASSAYQKLKTSGVVTSLTWNTRAAATFVLETLPSALRLVPVLRRLRPDVMHTCNGIRGNMDAFLAALICGIPCVAHSKGFDKMSVFERRMAPRLAAIVCMTKAIETHNRERGLRPPEYHVIYDGLDLAQFRPRRLPAEVRAELGIAPERPVVGLVGNIQQWKGQHVLLEALLAVRRERPDILAVLVGGVHRAGAEYAERLHAFVREKGLSDSVLFTGPRSDVSDLMHSFDVIAHTSVPGEPFGRVSIEGMSVGRPVVATRGGGVPELIQDGVDGLLVPPGDAAELARTLLRLFGDAELRARLSAAAVRNVERFSLEHHVAEVTAIYERVVAGRFASPRTASQQVEGGVR